MQRSRDAYIMRSDVCTYTMIVFMHAQTIVKLILHIEIAE